MFVSITSAVSGKPTLTNISRADLSIGDVVTLTSSTAATTYLWQISYRPPSSSAVLSGSPTAQNPGSFTVDAEGSYLAVLTVDASLPTEATLYLRLSAKTTEASLLLNAATEQYNPAGISIPTDIGPSGWANNLNANLLALEAYSRTLWLWQDYDLNFDTRSDYQYQSFFPIVPVNASVGSVPAGVTHFMPLDGYTSFSDKDVQNGFWVDPSNGSPNTFMPIQWSLSNDDLNIESNGYPGAAPPTSIASARWGRGSYYIEIEASQVTGADVYIGLVGTEVFSSGNYRSTSSVRQDGVLAYGAATGDVYVGGSLVTPWAAPQLSNGDVFGVLVKFLNPDAPTINGPNGWVAQAYFRINGGPWLNGANPLTDTGGVSFTNNFTQGYVFGASLDTATLASATWVVLNAGSVLAGDYIEVGSAFLSAGVSWRAVLSSPSTGLQTLGLLSNNAHIGTLTGVMTSPDRSLGQFNASLPTALARATDIATTINDPSSPFAPVFSASVLGNAVVLVPAVMPGTSATGISFGTSTGSLSGLLTRFFPTGSSDSVMANNIAGQLRNLINGFNVNAYSTAATISIQALPPGPGNQSVSTIISPSVITVNSLANGLAAPELTLRPSPSSWFSPAIPALPPSADPWYTNGDFEPNPYYTVPATFSGSGPPIDVQATSRSFITPNGIGRSLWVVTDSAYDGGDVEVTFVRFDTLDTVVRTVTPTVGGGTVHIEVPIQRISRIRTLGGSFTAGNLSLQIGPLWTPVLAPSSNIKGIPAPSPISPVPPPHVVVRDINQGVFQVTLDVAGEDGNMLDLYGSNPYPPSPSGDRRYFSTRVYFVITSNP